MTLAAVAKTQRPQTHYRALLARVASYLFTLLVLWAMYRGWSLRERHYLTAENGAGYWLGIAGGSMMLLLLLYPLRKHLRFMRQWGAVRYWFFTHMLFGILGPLLILFHANFGTGSLNSNVALACMLLVAGSGLVGRFLYTRIHHGLYGRKASLDELITFADNNRAQLAWINAVDDAVAEQFRQTRELALRQSNTLSASAANWLRFMLHYWWQKPRIKKRLAVSLTRVAGLKGWSAPQFRQQRRQSFRHVNEFFSASRKVLEFGFYERLFSLWHVIHLPFFIMLVLSGIVHVIAVHMY